MSIWNANFSSVPNFHHLAAARTRFQKWFTFIVQDCPCAQGRTIKKLLFCWAITRGRCCPPWPSHIHWKQICDTTLAQQPFELLRRASDVGRFSAADVAPTRRAVAIVPKAACRLSPNRQAIVYRMSPAEYLSARLGDEPRLSQTLKHQSIYKRRSVQGFRTSHCNAL